MKKEELKAIVDEIRELVSEVEEPFRSISFEVLLRQRIEAERNPILMNKTQAPTIDMEQMSISEFLALAASHTKSHIDTVEAIAYYYLHTGQQSVTRSDIDSAYGKARLTRPKNFSDIIAKCVKRGHLSEAPDRKDNQKAWQITLTTGEPYIQNLLELV